MNYQKRSYVLPLALCAGAVFPLDAQVTPVPGVTPPKVGANAKIQGTTAAIDRSRQDPASVARGNTLFVANCGFCHGATAKGTDIGPDLMRSVVVLDDDKGELLFPKVRSHSNKTAISGSLTDAQLTDIDAWLKVQYYGIANRNTYDYLSIVLGDARKGEALFNGAGKCSTCHSVTGDLAGIGSRTEPHTLQSLWISGGGGGRGGGRGRGAAGASGPAGGTGGAPVAAAGGRGARGGRGGRGGGGGGAVAANSGSGDAGSTVLDETPPVIGRGTVTITVTLPDGTTIDGVAMGVNDFTVAMKDMQGKYHSWTRIGDFPKVVTHNPLQAHGDILRSITDDEMHNMTAYLVTIK